MSLQTTNFPPTMDTSQFDLTADFFMPTLTSSTNYDRGVGFFSSGWLQKNARGMRQFSENDGRARWVTSPILSPRDWEALKKGKDAQDDPILLSALEKNIQDLENALERKTLSALAWMVADGILDFKLALPQNRLDGGDFHDKFGIFTDKNKDRIAFRGSYNDSIQGLRNFESINIFKSWDESLLAYVDGISKRFEMLWHNQDPNVRTFDLPEAAREQILQLRVDSRPYSKPNRLETSSSSRKLIYQESLPKVPQTIELRDYQEKAIEAWFNNQSRGLYEMATGTGKTITALATTCRLFERENRLAVIVAVPYQHLVDQWDSEAQAFGFKPILAYESKTKWVDKLNDEILSFNHKYRKFISVIVTHSSFAKDDFQQIISKISGPTLIIADEAHHLGAEQRRKHYPQQINFRLALSATPDRWFDDVGTAALREYFGETVFSFPLEQAIGVSLTPYYYHPHLVELTAEELNEYHALSVKVAKLFGKGDEESDETIQTLLRKRANLLNKAQNKIETLSQLLDQETNYVEHTLFYCAPGQINEVTRLLGVEKSIDVHKFTAEEPNKERQTILKDFASGELQGLVAMKCLDEGVDVPSTKTAYFLASSGNPREFIQRRGRILRRYQQKRFAIIHDLIATPPASHKNSPTFRSERSIVRRELQRFREFANPAQNKHEALNIIWDLAAHYGLRDI